MMNSRILVAAGLLAVIPGSMAWGQLLESRFTYQGRLMSAGADVNAPTDFQFTLWVDPVSVDPNDTVGATIARNDVNVADGLFTVELDFGANAFSGEPRWLEIAVRSPHDPNDVLPFTTLSPRQPITAAPYAVHTRGLHVDDAGNLGIGTPDPLGVAPLSMLTVEGDTGRYGQVSIISHEPVGADQAAVLKLFGSRGSQAGPLALMDNDRFGLLLAQGFEGAAYPASASIEFRVDGAVAPDSVPSRISFHTTEEGETARTQRMVITDSGNVGIGSVSPAGQLHVDHFGNVDTEVVFSHSDTELIGGFADSAARLTLTSSAQTVVPDVTETATASIRVESNTDGDKALQIDAQDAGMAIALSTGGTERMRIDESGNVGIGTTPAPTSRLYVDGNADIDGYVFLSDFLNAPTVTATQLFASELAIPNSDPDYRAVRMEGFSEGNGSTHSWGEVEVYGANGYRNVLISSFDNLGGDHDYGFIAVNGPSELPFGEVLIYVDPTTDEGVVAADVVAANVKNFRVPNPREPGTEIVYASLEGPEAGAYARGTARLRHGTAIIQLPQHFGDIAAASGMTVQLTPLAAESLGLAVIEKSPERIMVKELQGGSGDYEFDYVVMAVRNGYEDYQVIRPANDMDFVRRAAASEGRE